MCPLVSRESGVAKKKSTTATCRYCGERIKSTARACPHCGSDWDTGWSDSTYLDGVDLPDAVDYEDMVEQEFGRPGGRKAWWRSWKLLVAAGIVLLFVVGYLRAVL
jgi:hypothetical protein